MNIDTVGANADNDVKALVRQPGDSNRMWSIEELRAFLGVFRDTFRSWRKHGRGPANEFRFGKVFRFAEQGVVDWVAVGCSAKEPRRAGRRQQGMGQVSVSRRSLEPGQGGRTLFVTTAAGTHRARARARLPNGETEMCSFTAATAELAERGLQANAAFRQRSTEDSRKRLARPTSARGTR